CGLKCYTCSNVEEESCKSIKHCPIGTNSCFSLKTPIVNLVTKGCELAYLRCTAPYTCCQGDLCNGAITTGSGVFLVLMSSALFMFLI
ncbi:hypothetical protein CHARACLAT_033574, partial [Characodon lateralis]|nr:hypothetical protein [Characodon lateralis]